MIESRIERENGAAWLRCTAEHPVRKKVVEIDKEIVRVYHPDSVALQESLDGADTQYECPHCKLSWWVERDG